MMPLRPSSMIRESSSAMVMFESGLVGRIGRTGGDAVTISGDGFVIQLFADGAETYLSTVPEGDLYMTRTMLPQELSDAPGGTAAALAQLANAGAWRQRCQGGCRGCEDGDAELASDLRPSAFPYEWRRTGPVQESSDGYENHGFNEWQTCLSGRMARCPGAR